MLPTELLHLLHTMALGGDKMVWKRSARTFSDDNTTTEKSESATKRISLPKLDEASSDFSSRRVSTSTAASQSSLEPSPVLPDALEKRSFLNDRKSDSSGKDSEFEMPEECVSSDGRPVNFGVVVPGVYRSGYPQVADYEFLDKLKLRTIVTLVQKEFPEGYKTFISDHGIQLRVFDMKGTKKEAIPNKTMKAILSIVLDRRNYPLLIHCNHGKHRTGCVVGIVRKVAGWDVDNIIEEYKVYADPKIRENDLTYITNFELANLNLSNSLVKETNIDIRMRNFVRACLFSIVVMIVWFVSGSKLAATKRRVQEE